MTVARRILNVKRKEQSLTYLARDPYHSMLTYLGKRKGKRKKAIYADIMPKAAFFALGAVRRPAAASAAAASKTERELIRLAG